MGQLGRPVDEVSAELGCDRHTVTTRSAAGARHSWKYSRRRDAFRMQGLQPDSLLRRTPLYGDDQKAISDFANYSETRLLDSVSKLWQNAWFLVM